jgi:WD40 repeat protein
LAVAPRAGGGLVSGSEDRTVRTWSGEEEPDPEVERAHTGKVYTVALGDSTGVAVSGGWGPLGVWEPAVGEPRTWLKETLRKSMLDCATMLPGGNRAVSLASDQIVEWDVASGGCRTLLTCEDEPSRMVLCGGRAVTVGGPLVFLGSNDHDVSVWNLQTGQREHRCSGHEGPVLDVAGRREQPRAMSVGTDQTVRLWDVNTGECLQVAEGLRAGLSRIAMHPDGQRCLLGRSDPMEFDSDEQLRGTIELWDVPSARLLWEVAAHDHWVAGLAIDESGTWAVSASWDHTVKLWQLASGACRGAAVAGSWVTSCDVRDGKVMAGTEDGEVLFFEVR